MARHAGLVGRMLAVAVVVWCAGCSTTPNQGGWYALRWMEKPGAYGPSTQAAESDRSEFVQILSYDARTDAADFENVRARIREGDLVAFRMTFWDAYRDILTFKLNKVGYRLFKYGHLAMVVRDPDAPARLRQFSSESFKGPNVKYDIESLKKHDFDLYRLKDWERVDRVRMYEFVDAVIAKAGNWTGYDFMGMFGLHNSNMRPTDRENIGRDYTCSTVVVSALYYAGLELDAIQRDGYLDIVTPQQVVDSRGRFIPSPAGTFIVESGEYERGAFDP